MRGQFKYFIFIVITGMLSCKNDSELTPEGIIAKDTMIEVMAEFELTQALIKLNSYSTDTINEKEFYNEVYTTYNISREEFNSSLDYYCQDPKLLRDMYAKVIENLTKQQSEQQRK